MLLAAGSWIVLEASSVSAQTTGTDAIKMFDKDGDGSIDLKEAKAAAAAEFDKIDKDHEGTVDNEELGGRVTLLDQQLQEGRFRFWKIKGTLTKDQYLELVETQFKTADPDNNGTLDAKELEIQSRAGPAEAAAIASSEEERTLPRGTSWVFRAPLA